MWYIMSDGSVTQDKESAQDFEREYDNCDYDAE